MKYPRIKLVYLKGSKEMSKVFKTKDDTRMWNVIEPKLPGYGNGLGSVPTLGLAGLRENGLIQVNGEAK